MILEQALSTGKAIARWRAPVDLLMELSLAWEAASDSTNALKFARAAATRALENAGLTSEAWVVATRVKYEFEKARDETAHAHRAAALERDRATILSGEVDQRRQAEAEQRSLAESLRVRTTELEFANKELESFSYSVSHDLRAPLRSIDGFSAALAEDYAANLDAIALDYIKRVRNSAQRMGELIDDMLELSQISRTDINLSRIDISALAHQIADELSGLDPERQVRFEIAPGMTARADPSLMRILMTNLLNNAFKFTAKVSGALIKFGRVAGDEETTFFVCDNGAGFDMVYADKLFAPFQRLHRVEDFAGTGIGLATVARIIARHRGRVWAEAAPGQGATFYFSIPLDATLLGKP
jgi:signal transduction histidine kinase